MSADNITMFIVRFNECYGVLGVLDLLHGTDQRFRSSRSFTRHVMMLSLTPARILFPDPDPSVVKPAKIKVNEAKKHE